MCLRYKQFFTLSHGSGSNTQIGLRAMKCLHTLWSERQCNSFSEIYKQLLLLAFAAPDKATRLSIPSFRAADSVTAQARIYHYFFFCYILEIPGCLYVCFHLLYATRNLAAKFSKDRLVWYCFKVITRFLKILIWIEASNEFYIY